MRGVTLRYALLPVCIKTVAAMCRYYTTLHSSGSGSGRYTNRYAATRQHSTHCQQQQCPYTAYIYTQAHGAKVRLIYLSAFLVERQCQVGNAYAARIAVFVYMVHKLPQLLPYGRRLL